MSLAAKRAAMMITAMSCLALPALGHAQTGREFVSYSGARIMDTATGLHWAVDAGMPSFKACGGGKKTWSEAAEYIKCLNEHRYLGHSDWRLPSTRELSRLISKIASAEAHNIARPKLAEMGFKNVQSSLYWSSDLFSSEVALAVEVLTSGETHPMGAANRLNVWPVRGETTGRKK